MIVTCPECDKTLRLKPETAGKRIRCPKCSAVFMAETADDDDERDPDDRPPARAGSRSRPRDEDNGESEDRPARRSRKTLDSDEDEDDRERVRRRKKKKKGVSPGLLWGLIGGGAALVIGGIVVVILLVGKGSAYSQNEAAAKEMVGLLKDLVATLETVKNPDSARQAAVKVNQICDRAEALGKRVQALPKLTSEEETRLKKMLESEMSPLTQRMFQVGRQADINCGREPSFMAAIRRLQGMRMNFQR